MTHLRIELNGITEDVSSSVISKLYEIINSGVDASSNLQGRLHCPISYRAYVNYLTTEYPDLYISVDDYAISFEDPNMITYLNSLGIGSNGMITEALAATATIVANSANTQVTKFNELKYFTSITGSRGGFSSNGTGDILFNDWTALEEIDISNFTSLGHGHTYGWSDTFYGCTSLKKVTASNKLVLIGHCAFRNCSNLEDITGLSGEIELACSAFNGCSKLKNSNFTNVLFLVGGHDNDGQGFKDCTTLTSLLISLNSTEIPSGLFRGCSNLTSVTGLQNITKVKGYAFQNCSKLASIDIDWTKITRIEGESFKGCELLPIASLNCTSLLTLDTPNAFRNCKLLQSITSLGTITTTSNASFNGCTGLTSVTLPSTLTTLGDETFYGCTSLPSITLPSSCTSIGVNAFYGCSSLLSVVSGGNVTTLYTRAFCNCSSLTTITGLSNVVTIQDNVFEGCTNLTSVDIDFSKLNNNAVSATSLFKNCAALQQVDLSTIVTLGIETFSGCSQLSSIGSLDNLLHIGSNTFKNCSNVQEFINLSMPSLTTIDGGNSTFQNCTQIQHVLDLGQITTFGNVWGGMFEGCTNLLDVTIPSTVTTIKVMGIASKNSCPNMRWVKILSTQVPLYDDVTGHGYHGNRYGFGEDYMGTGTYNGLTYPIYVLDNLYLSYLAANDWSHISSRLRPMSQFATDFPNS